MNKKVYNLLRGFFIGTGRFSDVALTKNVLVANYRTPQTHSLRLKVDKVYKTIALEDQVKNPLDINLYARLLEFGKQIGYRIEGLNPVNLIRDGKTSFSTLEHVFANASRGAYETNVWISQHPEEVARRLRIYDSLSKMPEKSEVFSQVDNLPTDKSLVARISDISADNIHPYSAQSINAYVALNPSAFLELKEPQQVLVRAGGAYSCELIVSAHPNNGSKPIGMPITIIQWD